MEVQYIQWLYDAYSVAAAQLCRRGFSASLPLDEEEPEYPPQERRLRRKYFGEEKPVRLSLPFSAGERRWSGISPICSAG